MNFMLMKTKVFAFLALLFANCLLINAQTDASIYRLPSGTTLRVRMDNEINSKISGVDDTFTMTLAAPVVRREVVVLPIGTIIEGRVVKVKRAAFAGKNGNLQISLQSLRLTDGTRLAIEGGLVKELKIESSPSVSILTILGGTAVGGIVGAAAKSTSGALIGAGLGAGAGTGIAFLRKGRDVSIKAGADFEIRLSQEVVLPVTDF